MPERAPLFDTEAEVYVLRSLFETAMVDGPAELARRLDALALQPSDFVTDELHPWVFSAFQFSAGRGLAWGSTSLIWAHVASHVSKRTRVDLERLLGGDTMVIAGVAVAHAERLRDLAIRRSLAKLIREQGERVTETEVDGIDLVLETSEKLRAITSRKASIRPLRSTIEPVSRHIQGMADGRAPLVVPSGFNVWDDQCGGVPATLAVIVGKPSVGKSALVAGLLRNMAIANTPPMIFSMEDQAEWLTWRYLAHESAVNQFTLRNRKLNDFQHTATGDAFGRISKYDDRILFDDRPLLTPREVLQTARVAVLEHGARSIWLDNMTAMKFPRGGQRTDLDRQEFLTDCRALAIDLRVPFVVLSHVKASAQLADDKMPSLFDCSETAAFANLCRFGVGVCRAPDSNVLKVGVLKNTNGKRGTFDLPFIPAAALVSDPEKTRDLFGKESA